MEWMSALIPMDPTLAMDSVDDGSNFPLDGAAAGDAAANVTDPATGSNGTNEPSPLAQTEARQTKLEDRLESLKRRARTAHGTAMLATGKRLAVCKAGVKEPKKTASKSSDAGDSLSTVDLSGLGSRPQSSASSGIASLILPANALAMERRKKQSARILRVAKELNSAGDPDLTDASPSSSGDEADGRRLVGGSVASSSVRNNPPPEIASRLRRVERKRRKHQARWDNDRCQIGWRWTWLNLRLNTLDQTITECREEVARLRRERPAMYEELSDEGPVEVPFGTADVTAQEEAAAAAAEAASASAAAAAAAPPRSRSAAQDAAAAAAAAVNLRRQYEPLASDGSAARSRCVAVPRRRKLEREPGPRRPAPMIKHRVGAAVTSELIRMRAAVVDRSFHPVLSLVEDAPKSLLRAARSYRKTRQDQPMPTKQTLKRKERKERHTDARSSRGGRKGTKSQAHPPAGAAAKDGKPSSNRKREKLKHHGGTWMPGRARDAIRINSFVLADWLTLLLPCICRVFSVLILCHRLAKSGVASSTPWHGVDRVHAIPVDGHGPPDTPSVGY